MFLGSALADAVDDELIETNPMAGWVYRNAEAPKEEDDIDPFTADEQGLIAAITTISVHLSAALSRRLHDGLFCAFVHKPRFVQNCDAVTLIKSPDFCRLDNPENMASITA